MTSSTFLASDGDGYELNMGRWSRRLAGPFIDFANARNAGRTLDVGCGTGSLSGALAAAGARAVHSVDLSPTYVRYAHARHSDARLSFQVGDACALGVVDGAFDCVLSLLVLHFVPQPARAIQEMRRVARPGAIVSAAVWDARGGFVANRLFFDTAAALDANASQRRGRNYTRLLTRPGELAAAWREAGFHDVVETTLSIRMDFSSFADYWQPYTGNDGPGAEYVRTLAMPERARLEAAVRAAYLDGEADGPRSFAALAWAVKGTA